MPADDRRVVIWIAICLFGAALAVDVLAVFLTRAFGVGDMVRIALTGVLFVGVINGWRIARWATITISSVIALVGMIGLPGMLRSAPLLNIVGYSAYVVVGLACAVLLTTLPPVRRYFRAAKAESPRE